MSLAIEIKLLHKDAKAPLHKTPGSAGVDLCAMGDKEYYLIQSRGKAVIPTGIAISINDPSIVAIATGRSGLGFKHGVRLSNSVGVIDSDYQGEILLSLHNDSDKDYVVHHGDRIAQLMFVPVYQPNLMVVSEFSETTARGENGIGSTGRA